MKLTEVKVNGVVKAYTQSAKDNAQYMPEGEIVGVGAKKGVRFIHYRDAVVELTDVNKEIGVEVGNICPICNAGEVMEYAGCNTCKNCSAQLKCGL